MVSICEGCGILFPAGYRNEMKEIREYYIRASESLKQLHKRVDRIDKIIDESHPHQYIEE